MANPTISQIKVGDITYDVCDATSRDTLFNTSNINELAPILGNTYIKASDFQTGVAVQTTRPSQKGGLYFNDVNDSNIGVLRPYFNSNGNQYLQLATSRDNFTTQFSTYLGINSQNTKPLVTITASSSLGGTTEAQKAWRTGIGLGDLGTNVENRVSTETTISTSTWTVLNSMTFPKGHAYIITLAACFYANTTGTRIITFGDSNTTSPWSSGGDNTYVRQSGASTSGTNSNTILRSTFIGDYKTADADATRYLWVWQNSGADLKLAWYLMRRICIS